jgi:D-xylose transport system substrate-binding protein
MIYKNCPRLFAFLVALSLIVSCVACDRISNEFSKKKTNDEEKIKIGLALATLQEERWPKDRDIFVAKAKEFGADVIVQIANNNSEVQENQVKYLLEQGIDVLVFVPHDAENGASIVQMAKSSGVKVISYDRLVYNANVDMYVSFDNVRVGEIMAEQLVAKVPNGNYVIINGAKSDSNSWMYNKGYMNVLDNYVKNKSITIINEVWTDDWRPEDSFKCIEQTLQDGYKIDAIIAANDSLASAAIEALAEKRLAGKVEVAGMDADLLGCQRLVEGTQSSTIYKPIEKIAEKAAELSVKIAKGEKVTANSEIFDKKYTVPYYKLEPIAVTKYNLQETVIQDGFHRMEEIYRNVPKSQWPSNLNSWSNQGFLGYIK